MLKLLFVLLIGFFSLSVHAVEEEVVSNPPLSEQDQKILDEGKVSQGGNGAGDMLGTFLGFGLGHAMQGRWRERGWIFTAGELATLTMALTQLVKCGDETSARGSSPGTACSQAVWWGGGFAAFKIWEIIDLVYWAEEHDQRLDELERQGYRSSKLKAGVAPVRGGAVLGLAYQF